MYGSAVSESQLHERRRVLQKLDEFLDHAAHQHKQRGTQNTEQQDHRQQRDQPARDL